MKLACRENDRTSTLLAWATYGLRPADDVDYLIRRMYRSHFLRNVDALEEVSSQSSGLLSDVQAAIGRPCTAGACSAR
jgi:hypothetical protein